MSCVSIPVRRTRSALLSAATAIALSLGAAVFAITPAQAQRIVYDPSNHAQAILQATRALQTVNNQIRQLQNEAQMLASLNLQMAPELQDAIGNARELFEQAQAVRYNLSSIAQEIETLYPDDFQSLNLDNVLTQSDAWMGESRTSLEALMRQQARAAEAIGGTQGQVRRALGASAGASGQTSAIQASNQMLGVLSTQLAELQALQIAQSRALATERLEQEAREARAREIRRQAFPTTEQAPVDPARSAF